MSALFGTIAALLLFIAAACVPSIICLALILWFTRRPKTFRGGVDPIHRSGRNRT